MAVNVGPELMTGNGWLEPEKGQRKAPMGYCCCRGIGLVFRGMEGQQPSGLKFIIGQVDLKSK
jgi:hypothetical protein